MPRDWSTSRAMLERARRSLAGGVSSPFRARAPRPLYFRDGRGARLEDVDGNTYIDYTLAWGPNILGCCHPRIVAAVEEAARGPHTYGAQHELEYVVAERVQSMVPCAERVLLSSSGSEAVQCALRLARAATGRDLILKFEGHYHGWMDSVLVSYQPSPGDAGPPDAPRPVLHSRGQPANAAENVVVTGWNSADAVKRALEEHAIAAVVMEPVMANSGCLLPLPGYLEAVRELCARHGALLVFDEVITGFRMALGGAQAHYSVTPDLAIFGKALGGGLPISAVAGRRDVMELVGCGAVFGGTFNGNPLVLAASEATLDVLSAGGLDDALRIGAMLMEGICRLIRERNLAIQVCGFPTAFALHYTSRLEMTSYRDTLDDDAPRLRRLIERLMDEGVYILPDGRFYVSAAHTEDDVSQTLDAFGRALDQDNSGKD